MRPGSIHSPPTPMVTTHRTQVRRELLDAASELFATIGYAEVTHADIAIAASIGRTTFYEYFSSKEDLLVQLVEDRLPRLAVEILDSIPEDLGTVSRLGELSLRMIEFVATDPLGVLLHTEVQRLDPESQQKIAGTHTSLTSEFVKLYRRGVREGVFRSMPADVAGRLIHEVIMAAGRVLKAAEDPAGRVGEVAGSVVGFLIAGMSSD